jgi:hypothetical protein
MYSVASGQGLGSSCCERDDEPSDSMELTGYLLVTEIKIVAVIPLTE